MTLSDRGPEKITAVAPWGAVSVEGVFALLLASLFGLILLYSFFPETRLAIHTLLEGTRVLLLGLGLVAAVALAVVGASFLRRGRP